MENESTLRGLRVVFRVWIGLAGGAGKSRKLADTLSNPGVDKAFSGALKGKWVKTKRSDTRDDSASVFGSSKSGGGVRVGVIGVDERGGVIFEERARGRYELVGGLFGGGRGWVDRVLDVEGDG